MRLSKYDRFHSAGIDHTGLSHKKIRGFMISGVVYIESGIPLGNFWFHNRNEIIVGGLNQKPLSRPTSMGQYYK